MAAKLFYDDKSSACRAVLLTIKALGIALDLQEIDPSNKETLPPDFLKLNPQRAVPVLHDADLILCDSHAISGYLVSKYENDSTLYSCDLGMRALIDQKLYFDSNTLLPRIANLLTPVIALGEKEIPKGKLDALKEGYELLDKFLEENVFLAGENVTIADFSCVASVSTGSTILPVAAEIYPNLFKWYLKMKALPYYNEANGVGLNKLDALIESQLGSEYRKSI